MLFDPITINGVTLRNRVIRSSIGGRMAYYDGSVNAAWISFEKRFAEAGVGAIVSATLTVDDRRWSPIEYPKISQDRFVGPLRDGVKRVQAAGARYIIQIGDPGSHTQTSLLSQASDEASASTGFDLLYGYRTRRTALTVPEIEAIVERFAQAARRVREVGADGVEVTASKGYLIHQFLNPAINRRTDRYGGSREARFQLLREVVEAIRAEVGRDFLFGVRLSAWDHNHLPLNLRWPLTRPLRAWRRGNTIEDTLEYGRWMRDLGVDYLHISNGYGFINPWETPGAFPYDEVRQFLDSTRHLSGKAAFRSALVRLPPKALTRRIIGAGWKHFSTVNLEDARRFRAELGMPIIANGGFQRLSEAEGALESGGADVISMARPLLANPDLLALFRAGVEAPERPCTLCNRCAIRTTLYPLGCYDRSRFDSEDEMEAQILAWSANPLREGTPA